MTIPSLYSSIDRTDHTETPALTQTISFYCRLATLLNVSMAVFADGRNMIRLLFHWLLLSWYLELISLPYMYLWENDDMWRLFCVQRAGSHRVFAKPRPKIRRVANAFGRPIVLYTFQSTVTSKALLFPRYILYHLRFCCISYSFPDISVLWWCQTRPWIRFRRKVILRR